MRRLALLPLLGAARVGVPPDQRLAAHADAVVPDPFPVFLKLKKSGSATAKRALAIAPGAALHTCAPACPPKAVADARALWDGANRIDYFADGKVPAVGVGHEAFNFNLTGAGAGAGDWLVGVDEVPVYRETAPTRLNPDP